MDNKFKIILTVFLSFIIALSMSIHFLMPLLIVFSLVYLGLLFKKPEYALLLSVLMIFDFFSLIPEDFLRMPGVFRLKDIFLILAFVPFLNGLFNRDPKIRVVIKSVIGKCILFLIFITACQLFLTNFLYPSESVNSIFRAGRKYFYYLLFFPAYYILIDYGRLKSFIRLLVLSICSFCVLFMLQFFLADKVKIFSGKIAVQNLQGFMVTRMYLSGAALVNVIFLIVLFILLLSPIVKKKSYAEKLHTRYDEDLGWINIPNIFIKDMYGQDLYIKTREALVKNIGKKWESENWSHYWNF